MAFGGIGFAYGNDCKKQFYQSIKQGYDSSQAIPVTNELIGGQKHVTERK